jgi:hypothetical protein
MRRGFVFMLAGPVLVAIGAAILLGLVVGAPGPELGFYVMWAFLFAIPASVLGGLLDSLLARFLPVLLRVPLTAIISTIVSITAALALLAAMGAPSLAAIIYETMLVGFILMVSMGVCSVLSHSSDSPAS